MGALEVGRKCLVRQLAAYRPFMLGGVEPFRAAPSAAPQAQKPHTTGHHSRRLSTHCTTSCAVTREHRSTLAQPHVVIHSPIHPFIHSSVALKHARNGHALCDTKHCTALAQQSLSKTSAWCTLPPFSPALLVTGWWLGAVRPFLLCPPLLRGFLRLLHRLFPPCLPLSSFSSPTSFRSCLGLDVGRASPLELLLMVFGAY